MTPAELPLPVQVAWTGAVGLAIGSFLNVCVHRLPLEGQSVFRPVRSHCPRCGHEITWRENLPVVSWLLLRGRCSACRGPISVRYPLVELLTGVLFAVAAWRTTFAQPALLAVQLLVLAGILVATFVDFDRFEIPDEVSIGGMVVAPILSFLVPALHDDTWVARWFTDGWAAGDPVSRGGATVGSLAGLAVGAGVLLLVGWAGRRIYGREAMGLGDVKLLAAGGGFVGPGGALAALMLGSLVASVVGVANIVRFVVLVRRRARGRGSRRSLSRAIRVGRLLGQYLPFGPYLGIGIGIVLLAWNDVSGLLR
jgi:leader peptidase (prepilin peptidase)/N-methyltransferase